MISEPYILPQQASIPTQVQYPDPTVNQAAQLAAAKTALLLQNQQLQQQLALQTQQLNQAVAAAAASSLPTQSQQLQGSSANNHVIQRAVAIGFNYSYNNFWLLKEHN